MCLWHAHGADAPRHGAAVRSAGAPALLAGGGISAHHGRSSRSSTMLQPCEATECLRAESSLCGPTESCPTGTWFPCRVCCVHAIESDRGADSNALCATIRWNSCSYVPASVPVRSAQPRTGAAVVSADPTQEYTGVASTPQHSRGQTPAL